MKKKKTTFKHLDRHVCFRLYAVSRHVTQAYKPFLEPHGLTYPKYLVMLTLWENDGLKVSDISQKLFLEPATITPMLKKLEAQGFIERRRNAVDDRTVSSFVTKTGWQLLEKVKHVADDVFCQSSIDHKEGAKLETILDTLMTDYIPELSEK